MADKGHGLSLKRRLAFYLGGVLFATVSYIAGLWAYGIESAQFGDRDFYERLTGDLVSAFQSHMVTFFVWEVICTAISVTIAYLFDREVYYRRKAEQKANVDGLTDVFNHRYFQERLSAEIERSSRYDRTVSLIMLDLDDFKVFNDTWGHQEGDKLLMWFAKLCASCTRNIDVLARYGGEEFVIILPEAASKEAMTVAQRIRESTEKMSLTAFGKNRGVTVSAGIACYPEHGKTRHALVLSADAALYYAKQQGKNRCYIYKEECNKSYRASASHVKPLLSDEDMEAVEALGAIVDAREVHTQGHSAAVMRLAVAVGQKLALSAEEIGNLRAAALLHDLGKIATPEDILGKPDPLQSDEWKRIEDHAGLGSRLLKRMQQMGSVVPGVKHHHERFDGKGYPGGLAGKSIPLLARIIAIADAYDAMTNARPYRKAMGDEEAIAEIRRCAGTQFDPELVEAFIQIISAEKRDTRAA